jgi:hypothetical protein
MPTSTITNTTTDPSGAVVPNVAVSVTLFGQSAGGPPVPAAGFRISDGSEVVQTINLTSSNAGVWSIPLERNSNITPANTFYVAVENFPIASGGPRYWFFQVGSLNQTLQAALVSPLPALSASTFLTQTAGDARYVLAPGTFSGSTTSSTPGDAGTSGIAASYSRGDHQHQRIDGYGTATTNTTPGNPINQGTSPNLARSDHIHGLLAFRTIVHSGAAQVVASTTDTLLALDTIDLDPSALFNTTSHLWTAPQPGTVMVTWSYRYNPTAIPAANRVATGIYKNASSGAPQIQFPRTTGTATFATGQGFSRLLTVAANDTLGINVWQDTGANATLEVGASVYASFILLSA